MLSRLANRVYWLSRYTERALNSAKIANSYGNLILDLPIGTEVGWHTLIAINDADALFDELYGERTEENIMQFLLFDERYAGSIYSSICYARENARTSRDILPSETWEIINGLYLNMKNEKCEKVSRSRRYIFLNSVMHNIMRMEGMLNGGLSRNNTYRFIILGRNLERADTTTRVLDVGSQLLSDGTSSLLKSHEGVIWMNILRSMNAYQMYRQEVRRKVVGKDVVKFLLFNEEFPRSVTFCVEQIMKYASKLNEPMDIIAMVNSLEKEIHSVSTEDLTAEGVNRHMDELQKLLSDLNNVIEEKWFYNNNEI
ncbi:MAG: alpha-E domain-containing protein [Deferribacterales bacterium]|jgi:uncharacterized alpha-E superfamily protein